MLKRVVVCFYGFVLRVLSLCRIGSSRLVQLASDLCGSSVGRPLTVAMLRGGVLVICCVGVV